MRPNRPRNPIARLMQALRWRRRWRRLLKERDPSNPALMMRPDGTCAFQPRGRPSRYR